MSSNEAVVPTGSLSVSPAGTRRRLPRFQLLTLATALAFAAFLGWRQVRTHGATQTEGAPPPQSGAPGSPGGQKPNERPVVVQVVKAAQEDVNVVLNGLGSVIAKRSVLLRSRVPGQLSRIHFKEGDLVQAGQLLAEIDSRPFQSEVQRAAGQLTRDKALLEHARADLARTRALREEAIANQEEVDLKSSLVRQYEGTLQIDQGQLSQASLQLSYSKIIAPFAGRIGLRSIDVGNNVAPNDATYIATIHAVQPIDAVFSLPEDQLPVIAARLNTKTNPSLVVEAWDKGSRNRIAAGRLVALDNQVDPSTGTFKLKAEFANDDGLLFPNQFVNVRLVVETRERSVVVPRAAVQHGTVGAYVLAVNDEQVVHLKPVRLGAADGPVVAIEEGLAAGELVVVSGADRLREGARVVVSGTGSDVPGPKRDPASKGPARAELESPKP
jgi:membrane fusion protein, multidrug efflux system